MAPAEGDAAAPGEGRFGARKSRALQRREHMRDAVGVSLGVVAPGAYPGQAGSGQPEQRPCRGPGSRPAAGGMPWASGEEAQTAAEPRRRLAGATGGGVPAAAYAEALAAQVSEKQAAKAAQLARDRQGDRLDDRVRREAGELAAEAGGEEAQQRRREAAVLAREDSLTRFLAEKRSSAVGCEDELEARRRTVPGLCGPPAGPPAARRSCAGHRGSPTAGRSRPPRGACPRAAPGCDDQAGALPREHARGAGTSANVWARGADQNCGNFLADKPTSRVLRPPGGGGTLQIGSW